MTLSASWVERLGRKPNCFVVSRSLSSKWILSLQFIIFSKILPSVSNSEMGRKFAGLVMSFPGFGIRIIIAVLRGRGKYPVTSEALYSLVNVRSTVSGRCFMTSLPIWEGPGALLRRCEILSLTSANVIGLVSKDPGSRRVKSTIGRGVVIPLWWLNQSSIMLIWSLAIGWGGWGWKTPSQCSLKILVTSLSFNFQYPLISLK